MEKPIAEKIVELRHAKNLTQRELGELCGVSSQAISKWENGDSLPDIMLLPKLCEIFSVTADALLEVPAEIKGSECMDALFTYAKEIGETRAAFEAVVATSYPANRDAGISKMAPDGIKIHDCDGIATVISGEESLRRIKHTDMDSICDIIKLVTDDDVMAVIRVMDFGLYLSEDGIAEQTGLSRDAVELALFKLMKRGICEGKGDKYVLGWKSGDLFAVLAGLYIASPEGHSGIGNSMCTYSR